MQLWKLLKLEIFIFLSKLLGEHNFCRYIELQIKFICFFLEFHLNNYSKKLFNNYNFYLISNNTPDLWKYIHTTLETLESLFPVKYNFTFGIFIFVVSKLATFTWNFTDVFVMMVIKFQRIKIYTDIFNFIARYDFFDVFRCLPAWPKDTKCWTSKS